MTPLDAVKVWLDDVRPMPPGFAVHVRTAAEAIALLWTGTVAHISLDHDLGEAANGTGYAVATWIEEAAFRWAQGDPTGLPPLTWAVHSQNPVGVRNMLCALRRADRFWAGGQTAVEG
jgi:hypothetical protein